MQTNDSKQEWVKLHPASLGASVSLYQHLHVESKEREDDLDVALEITPERLRLIGLAMGKRVMTLDYDGETLQSEKHFMLPREIQAENVLKDLQLAFWPQEEINRALNPGMYIEDNGLQRTLFSGGERITDISYSGLPRWIGEITLTNHRYHYKLTIKSVSTSN